MSHSFLCDAWLSGKLRHGGTCPNPGELLQSRDLYSHPVLSVCICSKNNGWREMMVWDFFIFFETAAQFLDPSSACRETVGQWAVW